MDEYLRDPESQMEQDARPDEDVHEMMYTANEELLNYGSLTAESIIKWAARGLPLTELRGYVKEYEACRVAHVFDNVELYNKLLLACGLNHMNPIITVEDLETFDKGALPWTTDNPF